jgi:Na+-transporting methylmalonyl-CoA/oxaloacetate decarboxylase gamma subunit
MIDWTEAFKVGGFGFLTVFAVLVILAVAIWIQSIIVYRIIHRKDKQKQDNES